MSMYVHGVERAKQHGLAQKRALSNNRPHDSVAFFAVDLRPVRDTTAIHIILCVRSEKRAELCVQHSSGSVTVTHQIRLGLLYASHVSSAALTSGSITRISIPAMLLRKVELCSRSCPAPASVYRAPPSVEARLPSKVNPLNVFGCSVLEATRRAPPRAALFELKDAPTIANSYGRIIATAPPPSSSATFPENDALPLILTSTSSSECIAPGASDKIGCYRIRCLLTAWRGS